MTGFRIRAITTKGTKALDKCIQEGQVELSRKNLLDRMKFNKIWIHETTLFPLTDQWTVNLDFKRFGSIDIDECVKQVNIAMVGNGAILDVDYIVEVSK